MAAVKVVEMAAVVNAAIKAAIRVQPHPQILADKTADMIDVSKRRSSCAAFLCAAFFNRRFLCSLWLALCAAIFDLLHAQFPQHRDHKKSVAACVGAMTHVVLYVASWHEQTFQAIRPCKYK
jgi:hypothetical protein